MFIVYSSSDSYAFLTGISILSLLDKNKQCEHIHIFIMDNNISNENKTKIANIVASFNRQITFVNMPNFDQIKKLNLDTGRWNISTFGRLFMAQALPDYVDKALNIDCDTIINDSLNDLWNVDLTNKVFAGVNECISGRYRRNLGKQNSDHYFNGGLVLLNLKKIRESKYEDKFLNIIMQYGDSLHYLDQDVLNMAIPENEMVEVPLRFDVLSIYYYCNYKQVMLARRADFFYSAAEYSDAKEKPAIVHFTTCFFDGLRPWFEKNNHPYKNLFLEYKRMSPWNDLHLLSDKRPKAKKIISFLFKHLPRYFVCWASGIIHGIVLPNIVKKEMELKQNGKTN